MNGTYTDVQTDIVNALRLLHEPGDVFEVRALKVPRHYGKPATASGYFDDPAKAADEVAKLDRRGAAGVYVTLNPVSSSLLARAANRIIEHPEHTTSDSDITRRRYLLVDIDPKRVSGIAATDEERQTAWELAADIEDKLRGLGWSYPLLVDSGNGVYLLYRIDLPNDQQTTDLLKRFYAGLNELLEKGNQ